MVDESKARQLLPHTWHGFFGRFGRLTQTQRASIEPIVQGRSVVLCAPTASGKTEAVLGPMMERLIALDRNAPGPRILVVCPTRALCNDLHRRILRPVQNCGWKCDRKTGDSPSFAGSDPPELLVTTPESFDSMLSRRPASLRHIQGLLLDELHLLDGDCRGDHLRTLVTRLGAFCTDLQICAASATAAQSQRLARQYAGGNSEVVSVSGGRDRVLEPRLAQTVTLMNAVDAIADELDEAPGSKVLVFANTRKEVEWMTANLSDRRVFAHHGSLSKSERLRTEEQFLNAPSGVCVATMTLELGVDIGDVDRVILINPPPNVASFTQRVGRSNRRGGPIQVTGLYSSGFDRTRFEHMIECAEEGRLFPEPVVFRPSIIAQQAVSLIFQNPDGWVTAAALHARLPGEVRQLWTVADCEEILQTMLDDGYLYADSGGHYVADEPAEKAFEYGQIHAHIDAEQEVEVVDEATGRKIGTARWNPEEKARRESAGEGLLLGGQHRQVTRVRDRRVYVEDGDLEGDPEFLSRTGPRYSFELARDLARFIGHGDYELRVIPDGPRHWRVHHFFGTLWGKLLAGLMRKRNFTVKKMGPFFAECRLRRGELPEDFGYPEEIEEDVRDWLQRGYKKLLNPLQAGPWKRFVPDEMLHRWVVRCVRPGEFAGRLSHMEIIERQG